MELGRAARLGAPELLDDRRPLRGPEYAYPAGDAGAAAFVADLLLLGGAELQELWLAHDAAAYRTMGTGVATLIGQRGVSNATQAVGAKQPSMLATGASNSRGAIRFAAASLQSMISGANFAGVTGQRWGVMQVGTLTLPAAGVTRPYEFGVPAAGDTMREYMTTTQLSLGVRYDDGGGGVDDVVTFNLPTGQPVAVALFASNPHQYYIANNMNPMPNTPGLSVRVNGNCVLSFSRACDADVGFANMDLWLRVIWKMSGTGLPAGFADIMSAVRAYYGNLRL